MRPARGRSSGAGETPQSARSIAAGAATPGGAGTAAPGDRRGGACRALAHGREYREQPARLDGAALGAGHGAVGGVEIHQALENLAAVAAGELVECHRSLLAAVTGGSRDGPILRITPRIGQAGESRRARQ